MAYIKNTWVDQQVERPRTYQFNSNPDGSTTLIDDFGKVTELGTPVNADNLNHIEDGIAGVAIRIHNMTEVFAKDEWVKSGDKLYKSKQDQNKGHAVTESQWYSEVELGASKEVLNGKANIDLANTTPKLADSFLNKLSLDYTAGIKINHDTNFNCPSDGIVIIGVNSYQRNYAILINKIVICYNKMGGNQAGVDFAEIRVSKDDIFMLKMTNGSWAEGNITFYPMKGAN